MSSPNTPNNRRRATVLVKSVAPPLSEPTGGGSATIMTPRRKLEYMPDDPLLSAKEAAAERRQGLSTFWRDVRAGNVPLAYYVTPRCPRWRRSELRAAVDACRAPPKAAS